MRPTLRLVLVGLLVAALAPASSAAFTGEPAQIAGGWSSLLPERTRGNSVAVAPDGTAWFGASSETGPELFRVASKELSVKRLTKKGRRSSTRALRFDPQGNLWFARDDAAGSAILRRSPSGALSRFKLPSGGDVSGLAIGTEGNVWYTRAGRKSAAVGRVSPTGKVTQTPLARGSLPSSVVVGPDGAAWFTELGASKIGRISTAGELQLFSLGRGAHPRQIVAGPDGALWFSEQGRALPGMGVADRIGRISTDGQSSEFQIPFGDSTTALAADPRGLIWFATDKGEISSISTTGTVGGRGCFSTCRTGIESIALAPDGAIWVAAQHESCGIGCGGGAVLMYENLGTVVGEIPAGALTLPGQDPALTG
jgi:streptogramin lyase